MFSLKVISWVYYKKGKHFILYKCGSHHHNCYIKDWSLAIQLKGGVCSSLAKDKASQTLGIRQWREDKKWWSVDNRIPLEFGIFHKLLSCFLRSVKSKSLLGFVTGASIWGTNTSLATFCYSCFPPEQRSREVWKWKLVDRKIKHFIIQNVTWFNFCFIETGSKS